MRQPLSGITVVDLSTLLPGPFCSMIMADFGARVIKIERPGTGDLMRDYTPRYPSYSGNFSILNRNKESLTLNLKAEEGKKLFLELIEKSDVLIEGFRPGAMDRLGLGYEEVSKINKGLIYCSITGFGQESPHKNFAGHDINYLALNGILDLAGTKNSPPTLPGILVADIGGGSYPALVAILMALLARNNTGTGQYIDISMMDCSFLWLYHAAGTYFTSGEIPSRGGELTNGGSPRYQVYPTKDGRYLAVGALEDQFWHNLCDILGIDDPKIRDNDSEYPDYAIEVLTEKFLTRTASEWDEEFKGKDLCSCVIRNFEEAVSDPHFNVRGLLQNIPGPDESSQTILGNPIKLSHTPGTINRPAPLLGGENNKILGELGYTEADCKNLKQRGII
ncbi:MAG: CoA transferase [Desulfobacteraceae bacterium]|nr:CoA transferase [Desulfobacteraceae bacterium]